MNNSILPKKYDVVKDFSRVCDFLDEQYQPNNKDGNYLRPAWEYIHGHPYLDEKSLDKIGVWEDSGNIVGIVHYEHAPGEAFFEVHGDYVSLKPAMLEFAEKNLHGKADDGRVFLKVWVNDFDQEFVSLVKSRGYCKDGSLNRPLSQLKMKQPFQPDTRLPEGFHLKSLEEDNDLEKLDRLIFRGFNHGDEPPSIDREKRYKERQKQQILPGYRKDLNIVIEGPDGQFVALAGNWHSPQNRYAYLEPVCTDPDYRRKGLGKVAVLEGIRRCSGFGAQVTYVGSEQLFYQAIGFKKIHTCNCWQKYLDMD